MNLKRLPKTRPPIALALCGAGIALAAAALGPAVATSVADMVADFVTESTRYIVLAALLFALFWFAFPKAFSRRKLSRKPRPKISTIAREAVFSFCSIIIFLSVDIYVSYGLDMFNDNMYIDISDYGLAHYIFVLLSVFVVHDAYFYWMHRLCHQPVIYKRVHAVHHESTDPSPFTAYHFHPLEALLEGLAIVPVSVILLLFPWHASIPIIWMLGQLFMNAIGHLGFEIYPSGWNRMPLLRWKTTGLHHYMHHQLVGGNYGLYFRFWDKLCGTEFKHYESRYDAIFKDRKPGPDAA